LGISVDVDGDAYHKFLKDYKIDFPTVRDPDQKTSNLYGSFKMAGGLTSSTATA